MQQGLDRGRVGDEAALLTSVAETSVPIVSGSGLKSAVG
jgi:hypothetical protein